MESKATKTTDLPFYKIARRLLRTKIDSPKKVNEFYIDVNNFASEIASDELFLDEISSRKYSGNKSLHISIIRILGYGKAVEESKIFADSQALQKVNFNQIFESNPKKKKLLEDTKNEAILFFSTKIDNSGKEDLLRSDTLNIKTTRVESLIDKEIDLGVLVYKEQDIYYKGDLMKLPRQSVRICRLLMECHDRVLKDNFIEEHITEPFTLKKNSVGKAIHLLKSKMKKQGCVLPITRVTNIGYKFTIKNLH